MNNDKTNNNNNDQLKYKEKISDIFDNIITKTFIYLCGFNMLFLSNLVLNIFSLPIYMITHPFKCYYDSLGVSKPSYINEIKNLRNFPSGIKQIGVKQLYNKFNLVKPMRLILVYSLYKTLSFSLVKWKDNIEPYYPLTSSFYYFFGGVSAVAIKTIGYRSKKKENLKLNIKNQMSWSKYVTQPQFTIYYTLLFGTFDASKSIFIKNDECDYNLEIEKKTFWCASFSSISAQFLTQPFINACESYNKNLLANTATLSNNNINRFTSTLDYFKKTIKNEGFKSLFTPKSSHSIRSNIIRTPAHAIYLYLSEPFIERYTILLKNNDNVL